MTIWGGKTEQAGVCQENKRPWNLQVKQGPPLHALCSSFWKRGSVEGERLFEKLLSVTILLVEQNTLSVAHGSCNP